MSPWRRPASTEAGLAYPRRRRHDLQLILEPPRASPPSDPEQIQQCPARIAAIAAGSALADTQPLDRLCLVLQLSFCLLASIGPMSPKSGLAKTRTYRTT